MTIRRLLLGAFLVVSLTPSIILTYLAYVQSRDALRGEIEQTLVAQASSVSADLDHLLFERLQNALSWNHLDVMQDIRIHDVDKRVSQFLGEMKASYGDIYQELYCTDSNGRIVASSAPQLLGQAPLPARSWLRVPLPNGTVAVDEVLAVEGGDNRALPLRADIVSADGKVLGQLILLLDWRQVERILDGYSRSGRMALLLDENLKGIGASTGLRGTAQWNASPLGTLVLPRQQPAGSASLEASPLFDGALMLGFHRSGGFEHFPGLGWITVVLQPSASALVVVERMRGTFEILLFGTLVLTAVAAILVAGRIARPVTALTAFTRHFAREQRLPPPPPAARGEVGELTETFVSTVRDLDRSRQDLLRASRLAVAGEIAAMMAHEVRTPLGILRSSAQVLREEPGISPEGRELVSYIESETERINRLITAVLDSAKPRPPAFLPHDLRQIVHRCVIILAAQADKKGVAIEESDGGGDLRVDCDEEQMVQVILNLLLNSVQLVPERGRVSIECSQRGDTVSITVGDSGPGIAETERAGVFEPFVSGRPGGLGLGLSVVKQIVLAHRGNVEVDVSRWGGALFSIHLPRQVKS